MTDDITFIRGNDRIRELAQRPDIADEVAQVRRDMAEADRTCAMGLAALRQAAQLTQVELARRMGITQAATATGPGTSAPTHPRSRPSPGPETPVCSSSTGEPAGSRPPPTRSSCQPRPPTPRAFDRSRPRSLTAWRPSAAEKD